MCIPTYTLRRFGDRKPAVGAYQSILSPPTSICDVTYWLNYLSDKRYKDGKGEKIAAINAAGKALHSIEGKECTFRSINTYEFSNFCPIVSVEATTVNERSYGLRPQDKFLRDNISSNDILIVSIGGNDVAMMPTPCTIAAMAGLLCLPVNFIEHGVTCCAVPCNDHCCGCGPSLCSCAGSCPPCLGYFRHLFGTR